MSKAWCWTELSLLFAIQAAAEIEHRATLVAILLSLCWSCTWNQRILMDFRWFPMSPLCHSFGRFIPNPCWNLSALPRPWNPLTVWTQVGFGENPGPFDSVNPSWFWREPWPSLAVWLPSVIPVQPFDFLWSLHITGIIMANWATERLQQFELKRWKKVLLHLILCSYSW